MKFGLNIGWEMGFLTPSPALLGPSVYREHMSQDIKL